MKINARKIVNTIIYELGNTLPLLYCNNPKCKSNWGDALNPWLVNKLSGKKIIHSSDLFKLRNTKVYSCIGSILDNHSTPNTIIWGSGCLDSSSKIHVKPIEVLAVRGPRTRDKLMKHGVHCPAIYGDPALLFPKFYNRYTTKTNQLGLIVHFMDKREPVIKTFMQKYSEVKLINIECGLFEFIDQLKSCHHIASSSLHGLIMADAYNIPSCWIKLSDNINGDGIKYIDYFESQKSTINKPFAFDSGATLQQVLDNMHVPYNNVNKEELLQVCPFNYNGIK